VGEEPGVVAVVRREAVQQHRDRVLLADATGSADQAVGVGRHGEHQRVARPRRQVRVQGGDGGFGPAREHQVQEGDVTGLARRQAGGHVLGQRQGRPCGRYFAFAEQGLCLAGMGQGKTGVGGDGTIKGLDRAGVERQRPIEAPDVGVVGAGGGRGQGQVVAVCEHDGFSRRIC